MTAFRRGSPRRQQSSYRQMGAGMLALEPRFMFDGAAVADAAHAAADADAKALIPAVTAPAVVREADPAKDGGKKEVAFVDTSVADYKTLEAGIQDGVSIVEINGGESGLAQMAAWAQTHDGYDAIHVLSHGAEATWVLGSDRITDASLSSSVVQAELAEIGHALNAGGDLLLYGCDVAKGADGQRFVADLSAATGADVAASDDRTGKGGDWVLETAGPQVAAAAFEVPDYAGDLAISNFKISVLLWDGTDTLDAGLNNFSIGPGVGPDVDLSVGSRGALLDINPDTSTITLTTASGYTWESMVLRLMFAGDNLDKITSVTGPDPATATPYESNFSVSCPGNDKYIDLTVQANSLIGDVVFHYTATEIVTGPAVSSVTSTKPDGSYKVGEVIDVTVNFSEAVTVTGTPQLTLETGSTDRVLDYVSGSNSSALVFRYTVQAGDTSADLDYASTTALALNGGAIKAVSNGDNAVLTLATPGTANSLAGAKALVIDTTAPTLTSITRQTPASASTNADSLVYRVTFNEAVSNVDAADFSVTGTTATVTNVASAGGNAYDVTVSGGDLANLNGTVTLSFAGTQNITDTVGNALTSTAPTGTNNPTYTLDNAGPGVTSIARQVPSSATTNANNLVYRVTFDEAASNVDAADFSVTGTTATVTNVASAGGNAYDVTVSGGDLANLNGTVTLSFAGTQNITDALGNALTNTTPTGTNNNTYTVDNTLPRIASFDRQTPTGSPTNADTLVWRITFTEVVSGVLAQNMSLSGTTATITGITTSDNITYDVTASGGNLAGLNGTVTLSFEGQILDTAVNALTNLVPIGTNNSSYVVDNAVPTLTSITRQTPASATTNADSLVYRVTFNEAVSNVDATDFTVTGTTGTITNVNAVSATTYDITVSGGDLAGLNGSVTLGFGTHNITDVAGNSLTATPAPTGTNNPTYTLDNTSPGVTSIVRQTPSSATTNADTLVYRVTFDEAVSNVDAADFSVTGTTATVTNVASAGGNAYDVTVSGGDLANLNGTVTLSFAGAQNITDAPGNALTNTAPTGTNNNSYVLDNTAPTVTGLATANTFGIGGAAMTLNSSATVTEANIAGGGTITATISSNYVSADDVLGLTAGALGSLGTIDATQNGGTGSGGVLKINLAAGVTVTDVQNLLKSLTYRDTNASASTGTRVVDIVLTDAAGNTSATYSDTITLANLPVVNSIRNSGNTATLATKGTGGLDYTVTFNQTVDGVDASDFSVVKGAGITGTAVVSVTAGTDGSSTYTVHVDGLAGDGTVELDLNGTGTGIVSHVSSQNIVGGYTSGQTYTLDNTAPGITGVSITSGSYKVGDSVPVTIAINSDTDTYSLTGGTLNGYTLVYDSKTATSISAHFVVAGGGTELASGGTFAVAGLVLQDSAGNSNSPAYAGSSIASTGVVIDSNAPTNISIANQDSATHAYAGLAAGTVVGALSTTDASTSSGTTVYSLVADTGTPANSADNGKFDIDASGNLIVKAGQTLTGGSVYKIRVLATDAGGNTYAKNYTITGAPGPTVGAAATAAYTERASAATLDAGLTLTANGSTTMTGATVSITAGRASGDTLAAITTGTGITASYNATTGVLTLTGNDTLANYRQVLDTVTFANSTNHDPTSGSTTRTIAWQVHDEYANGTAVNTTLTIAPVNEAPTLTATTTTATLSQTSTFTANLFSSTAADVVEPSQSIAQLVITVTGIADGTAEILKVDGSNVQLGASTGGTPVTTAGNGYSVAVVYAGGTATLTITAESNISASAANSLINALQYKNTSATATVGSRSVTLSSMKDTGGTANAGQDTASGLNISSTVTIAANDTPVVSVPASVSVTEDSVTEKTLTGVAVTDTTGGETYTVTVSSSNEAGKVNLVLTGVTVDSGTNNSNSITFHGTKDQVNAALASLKYTAGGFGTDTVTVSVRDGGGAYIGGEKTGTATISVTATKSAPPPAPPAPPAPIPTPIPDPVPLPKPVPGLGAGGDNGSGGLVTVPVPQPKSDAGFGTNANTNTNTNANTNINPTPNRGGDNAGIGFTAPSTGGFQVVVVSRPAGGGDALVVNAPVRDSVIAEGSRISVTVPADAFAHTRADAQVTLAATRANGAALPGWMIFNPRTGTFEGTPPPGFKGEVVVKVVARDNQGREAVQTFKIVVGAAGQGNVAPTGERGQGERGQGEGNQGERGGGERQGDAGQPGPRHAAVKPVGRAGLTEQLRAFSQEGRVAKQVALFNAVQRAGKVA